MKRLLLICYYFPPLGMGGIWRPFNLYRLLPEFGIACDILTVKPVAYRAYEHELAASLDPDRVYRAGSRDPQRLMYLLGIRTVGKKNIERTRSVSQKYFPDSKIGWKGPAVRLGLKLVREKKYDCLLSTAPPMTSHVVAQELAIKTGLPWIADFRDYWTAYKLEDSFTDQRLIERGHELLSSIKSNAANITSVNHSIAYYLGGGKVIYNGFDTEIAQGWQQPPDNERFVIGLLGHHLESMETDNLLELLSRWEKQAPDQIKRLKIVQVGRMEPMWLRQQLQSRNLELECECHGQLPRKETVDVLSKAHLFYFGVTANEKADFLPGKTFDLVASGRPLLVTAPDGGEIHRVLEPSGQAHFVNGDIASAVAFMQKQFQQFESGNYPIQPLSEYAIRHTSRATVSQFADLIKGLP